MPSLWPAIPDNQQPIRFCLTRIYPLPVRHSFPHASSSHPAWLSRPLHAYPLDRTLLPRENPIPRCPPAPASSPPASACPAAGCQPAAALALWRHLPHVNSIQPTPFPQNSSNITRFQPIYLRNTILHSYNDVGYVELP